MEEQFLNLKLSIKLRELGFNSPCFAYASKEDKISIKIKVTNTKLEKQRVNYRKTYKGRLPDYVAIPLVQQAEDFIRESYYINSSITYDGIKWSYKLEWVVLSENPYINITRTEVFETYKEARVASIEEMVCQIENRLKTSN